MVCQFEIFMPYFLTYFSGVFVVYILFPWSNLTGYRRVALTILPLSSIALYCIYEGIISYFCIDLSDRSDVLIAWPTVGGVALLYLIRLLLVMVTVFESDGH